MLISGHKDIDTFRKYIKIQMRSNAIDVARQMLNKQENGN